MSKLSRSLRLKRACFSRGKLETYLASSSFAYSIRRIFNFCCAASDVLPSWRNLWISGPSLKASPHASTQDSPRDTAGVHARHRKSPRETPDGKSSSPPKKPYVFNLVFELYINFSELYIKWSRTIYKFLRTIYKNSGKFRDFRGNRTGSRGKVCERENTPLNSTRLTDSTQKTIQNIIILGGLVDSWRWNQ